MRSMMTTAGFQSYARANGRSGRPVHVDTVTVSLVLAILLLGLVMVTSASISIAATRTDNAFTYLQGQLLLAITGMCLAALVFCIPLRLIERLSMPLLIGAVMLLALVLLPGVGVDAKGAYRWVPVAGMNFQTSELARVLVLIYLASYAVRREQELRSTLVGLIKPVGLLGIICALLLLQPDYGAAAVLFATGFGLLFLAGARLRYVFGLTMISTGVFALLAVTSGYRMRRISAFLRPWEDPFGDGFQLVQSLIAIGRGEWFGVGLGESVQKLFYLPEAHTDFLFAVLAEELGLAGVILTLALFTALIWRSFLIARRAADQELHFGAYVAAGFGLWLGIQAFINIGVTMGVLPTKGLTLPLMSYGRSSLVVTLAWIGLVLRVHHETMQDRRGPASIRGRDYEDDV